MKTYNYELLGDDSFLVDDIFKDAFMFFTNSSQECFVYQFKVLSGLGCYGGFVSVKYDASLVHLVFDFYSDFEPGVWLSVVVPESTLKSGITGYNVCFDKLLDIEFWISGQTKSKDLEVLKSGDCSADSILKELYQ